MLHSFWLLIHICLGKCKLNRKIEFSIAAIRCRKSHVKVMQNQIKIWNAWETMQNIIQHSKADFHFPEQNQWWVIFPTHFLSKIVVLPSIVLAETGVCFMVANLVFYLLLFPLGRLALTNLVELQELGPKQQQRRLAALARTPSLLHPLGCRGFYALATDAPKTQFLR